MRRPRIWRRPGSLPEGPVAGTSQDSSLWHWQNGAGTFSRFRQRAPCPAASKMPPPIGSISEDSEDVSGVDEQRQAPPYQRVSIRSRAPSASYENR